MKVSTRRQGQILLFNVILILLLLFYYHFYYYDHYYYYYYYHYHDQFNQVSTEKRSSYLFLILACATNLNKNMNE